MPDKSATAVAFTCEECGRRWVYPDERWRSYIVAAEERERAFDGPDTIAVVCPAARERSSAMTDEPVEPAGKEKTEEQKDEDDIGAFLHDVRQHGKRMNLEAAEDMDELAAGAEDMSQYGSNELADQGSEWGASADEHRKRADEWAKLDKDASDDA